MPRPPLLRQACGAHMLVIDAVLEPAAVDQLPRLETQHPLNDSSWEALLRLIEGPPAPPPGAAPGPAAAAVAAAGAPTPAPRADGGAGVGAGGAAGASDSAAASAAWYDAHPDADADDGLDPQQHRAQRTGPQLVVPESAAPPPPPAAPGAPPDCATLAASGQLMLAVNGSLITTGCRAAAVISSGTTQTAVSDAGQAGDAAPRDVAAQSADLPRSLELPLASVPPESGAAAAATRAGIAAPLAAALLVCLLLGGWRPI